MHISLGIYLTAEENSGKPQLGDLGCATSHRLKWGSLPPNEVGRIAQHVRKGEGRKNGVKSGLTQPPQTGMDFKFNICVTSILRYQD